jgi:hypothetical protein
MPTINRSDLNAAKQAGKAMQDLALGWGGAAEAKTVAKFLETATTDAPAFHAFCDAFGKSDVWHPAQLKEFIESRFAKHDGAKEWLGSGSPLGVRLQTLTTKPEKDLDPVKVGKELNNFATGWFNNEVLVLLLNQLPAVLKDPFAFEAMAPHADRSFKVEEGAAAATDAIKKRIASTLKEKPDAATTKLLTKLQTALS